MVLLDNRPRGPRFNPGVYLFLMLALCGLAALGALAVGA
jgi:hypothetical protein